ncbi:cyclin-D1-binding protein 1 isoform X2 [Panthera tigris]|uniref:cyclin-D1-binding protein 1 isoform X2 n=1 Tax=Panthera tigris TaxID=9694 RepID=UPI001C6F6448|nr:cyclin-D1-binding protein 1 isoform X2 [Panthera tigris]
MANAAAPTAAVPTLAPPLEQIRHLAEELRLLIPGVRVGEALETTKEFNPETFWRRLNEAAVNVSREATTLTEVFSHLPLPSPQETQRFCEQVRAAIKAMIAVYYSLPKNQGITLRKLVRSTTLDIVDGMAQLMDVLFMTPTQSSENNDLISYNSVWTACQQVPQIPRDNKAAALSMLTKNVDFVKDAHEEMEQAVEECDPYCGLLNDTEDNSDNHGDEEDDGLGYPNNRDLYWSEEDQELIIPCLALVRASKACLKKIRISVAENGKKDQVAQLDDIVDISDEISPSVDDLALSIYPPMCHLTVRINSAKLVSVLKKALEITKASHVTPQPEDSWIPLLVNAVDHCMNRIKELTQNELELTFAE